MIKTGGPHSLRPQMNSPEQMDQKFKDVAKLYEKQFLREMVKAMRSTVHEGGFIQTSNAEKIFKEKLDDEYVEKWGDKGGIGLSDMIYDQLIQRYGEAAGIRANASRVKGPISAENLPQFQVRNRSNPALKDSDFPLTYEFQKVAQEKSPLLNPLQGKVQRFAKVGPEETLLEVLHEGGLRSRLVFRGPAETLAPGQELQTGQKVGLLSPDAQSFFWSLGHTPQQE